MSVLGFGMYHRCGKCLCDEGRRPRSDDDGFSFAEFNDLTPACSSHCKGLQGSSPLLGKLPVATIVDVVMLVSVVNEACLLKLVSAGKACTLGRIGSPMHPP